MADLVVADDKPVRVPVMETRLVGLSQIPAAIERVRSHGIRTIRVSEWVAERSPLR